MTELLVADGRAAPLEAGRPAQRATRLAFFVAGIGMSAWAPLVPFAKARAALSDGALGGLLLCVGAGSILAMPVTGALVARFGCRRVILTAAGLLCLTLPALATAAGALPLAVALFAFGASVGAVDCTMNIHAVIVARAADRPMMSGFHGLFSFGGIVGAAGVSGLLSAGASPLLAMAPVVLVIAVAVLKAGPALLPFGGTGAGSPFALPHGPVLLLGGLCFILFLTEGSVLDWSAVFLATERGMAATAAGLGYAAFSLAMTAGRLGGDGIVRMVGERAVIVGGALCAAAGLAMTAAVPWGPAALAGYVLVGLGSANIVPVLYTAVGRQTAVPEHVAVPAVTTMGYAGILSGPALIGFVAELTSLAAALLMIALLLLGVAASGRSVTKRPPRSRPG